jgi:hypothetical protein
MRVAGDVSMDVLYVVTSIECTVCVSNSGLLPVVMRYIKSTVSLRLVRRTHAGDSHGVRQYYLSSPYHHHRD